MKRISWFCLLALVALTAKSQPTSTSTTPSDESGYNHGADIPGGIVFCENKHAIYYHFKDQTVTNLTGDLHNTVVKWPITASADGKWLTWQYGQKFWVRQLPKGTPYPITYYNIRRVKESKPFMWKDNAIRMSYSPDGARIALEMICQGTSWNPINQSAFARTGDSYNGIFTLSTIQNQSADGQASSSKIEIYEPRYGNLSESSIASQNRPDLAMTRENAQWIYGWDWKPGDAEYLNRMIKKSAHFLTFSGPEMWTKGKKLAYFIYEMNGQFGPIEVRLIDSKINTVRGEGYLPGRVSFAYREGDVVKAWEIPVSLPNCEGLAVKPDGSLTVLSRGVLYVVDYSEIENGMKASNIALLPSPVKGKQLISYANNVFKVKSSALAYGGMGARCIQWVTNDSFLFLGKNNSLCLWKKGAVEILRDSLPSEFCYCSTSPFESLASVGHGKGGSKAEQDIKAGYISAGWYFSGYAHIRLANVGSKKLMEYSLIKGENLSEVNLAECQWQKKDPKDSFRSVEVPPNTIIALRDKENCSLIKINKACFEWITYEWESRVLDKKNLTPARTATKSTSKPLITRKIGAPADIAHNEQ